MSLYKQLWLAIALLTSLALGGSFIVSCLAAKSYLEEQLYRKNIDNASSLALSISAQALDDTTLELFINSQFDTGHYQFIHLVDLNGDTIAAQFDDSEFKEAPNWLAALFPINVKPGVAQVSSGWHQLGTLTLSSHTKFAYRQLWNSAKQLFYYFIALSLGASLLGSALLRLLTRPLHKAVDHARAIGERRFITTAEPRTLEFKAVIRSMNKLSQHVKTMLDEESSKLEKWRHEQQQDPITGLLNRAPVLARFAAFVKQEDENAGGAVVLLRIADLFDLNQRLGRRTVDTLLKHFGDTLHRECRQRTRGLGVAGRLNGSDFIVLLPGKNASADSIGAEIFANLNRVCRENGFANVKLFTASTVYQTGENISTIMSRTDSVLASAPQRDTAPCIHVAASAPASSRINTGDWRDYLLSALDERRFALECFPVRSPQDQLLHWEAPVRLIQQDKRPIHAGLFMPHIARLGLGTRLDLLVSELALREIATKAAPLGINLSASLLSDARSMAELAQRIKSDAELADRLWLEIPEFGVFQNIEGFRTLCQLLKPLQCKLGIEHVGQEMRHIGKLHDLGLDYVKIDRALIHAIDTTTSNQVLIRGLCTIVHSIGLQAIAEGVEREAEWRALVELGVDGGTGQYFSAPD